MSELGQRAVDEDAAVTPATRFRRARVTAFLHNRTFVLPDDVKEIFCDATRHRIARSVRAQAENIDADAILRELMGSTPIP